MSTPIERGAAPTDVREVCGPLLPWPAEALAALLEVPLPDLAAGGGLPLCWHWLYLLDHPRQQDLGADGHPVREVFPSPPSPGLRRMWAGGALTGLQPLRVGEHTVRISRVSDSRVKHGRSGVLAFVTVQHELHQRGEVAVRERQDIVYRDAAVAGTSPSPLGVDAAVAPAAGDWAIPVSPTLLFRFSALTYNAHRIHYDLPYAREAEGYPALVVNGGLTALMLVESARPHLPGAIAGYDARAMRPLFIGQGIALNGRLSGDQAEVWASGPEGGQNYRLGITLKGR